MLSRALLALLCACCRADITRITNDEEFESTVMASDACWVVLFTHKERDDFGTLVGDKFGALAEARSGGLSYAHAALDAPELAATAAQHVGSANMARLPRAYIFKERAHKGAFVDIAWRSRQLRADNMILVPLLHENDMDEEGNCVKHANPWEKDEL
jgi:hypothetical protein